MRNKAIAGLIFGCSLLFLNGCVSHVTQSTMPVTGAAGGAHAEQASAKLERCEKPLGTIAIYEDVTMPWYRQLRDYYKVDKLTPLLRLMIQQSNCFVVVERGPGMAGMHFERELAEKGELRAGSNIKKGQMVAVDYILTPTVVFRDTTGGVGGALIGKLPKVGGLFGGVAIKDATVTLLLTESRSGVQVAASEGSSKGYDMYTAIGALGLTKGSDVGTIGGGFGTTPESKLLMTAFLDAYNKMIKAVRNYKMQKVEGGLGKGGRLKVQD